MATLPLLPTREPMTLTSGKRVAKTIITTDTFVKVEGQWKLAAAHNSAVVYP
ncbi:MAG: hypothetical protein JWO91_3439 [Acidobacteriaceae bacterium]|nr:hypothetical protein [Acidobacteriaceae bacterium]